MIITNKSNILNITSYKSNQAAFGKKKLEVDTTDIEKLINLMGNSKELEILNTGRKISIAKRYPEKPKTHHSKIFEFHHVTISDYMHRTIRAIVEEKGFFKKGLLGLLKKRFEVTCASTTEYLIPLVKNAADTAKSIKKGLKRTRSNVPTDKNIAAKMIEESLPKFLKPDAYGVKLVRKD